MKKKIIIQIIYCIICIIIGVTLLSSVFIMGSSSNKPSLGLIQFDTSSPFPYLPLIFIVGLIIGALAIYLIKPSSFVNFLLIILSIASVTILIYAFITMYANFKDNLSVGSIDYPDTFVIDFMFYLQYLFFHLMMFYASSVLPGFLIGGYILYYLKIREE